jgi:GAF domain-containing protein
LRRISGLLTSLSLLALGGCLYGFAGGGLPPSIKTVAVLPFDNQTAEPLLINRDMESRRAALGATLVGKQSRSYLGVPIIAGRQAIGAISVQSIEEEGRFTASDMRLLSTIAANVGTAIRNASLFDQIKRQKEYYETIIATARQPSSA